MARTAFGKNCPGLEALVLTLACVCAERRGGLPPASSSAPPLHNQHAFVRISSVFLRGWSAGFLMLPSLPKGNALQHLPGPGKERWSSASSSWGKSRLSLRTPPLCARGFGFFTSPPLLHVWTRDSAVNHATLPAWTSKHCHSPACPQPTARTPDPFTKPPQAPAPTAQDAEWEGGVDRPTSSTSFIHMLTETVFLFLGEINRVLLQQMVLQPD